MDEFLKIVAMGYIGESSNGFTEENEGIENFLESLKKILSDEVYGDLEQDLFDALVEQNRYSFVEGMKLAINIMNGKYIPTL